jgi:hypothetical protein
MTTRRTSPSIANARSPKDQPMRPSITPASTSSGSAGSSRRRALTSAVAVLAAAAAAAAAATLSLTASPALADECPNEALRAQNNSTQLPECRAYELVTPVFKEGFAGTPTGFTDEGRLSYNTNGNYDNNGNGVGTLYGGNGYLATRTGSDWSTAALAASGPEFIPSPTVESSGNGPAYPLAYSSDLRSTLWNMRRSDQPGEVQDLYLRDADGVFTRIGGVSDEPYVRGGDLSVATSADLSDVLFSRGDTYEYVGTGGPRRTVSVDNDGQSLLTGGQCASTEAGVSADGRVIFLTCVNSGERDAVYARVDGTTTIAVSGSQCTRAPSDPGGACNAHSPASLVGSSTDGTKMFFTTSQQLVNGDTDETNDLYECELPTGTVTPVGSVNPCPDLREVSGAAEGAEVQGVVGMSDDGSRVYFVASGVLASNPGANDATAVPGGNNVYVWTSDPADPDGETRFVATADVAQAQVTPDGRYLLLDSDTPLIDSGPQADTDAARDVYRYDADTGALLHVSTETGGGGNEPGADARILNASHGAISDDGGSVVFTTSESLDTNDTNGTTDSYLWHEGHVSLISSGKPSEDQFFLFGIDNQSFGTQLYIQTFISPSGRDVFFTTTAQLIPSDVDTLMDTYDARVDGGFGQSTPPTCSGESCQGSASGPPPESKPDSASSTGQDGSPQVTPAFSVGKLTASQLKRLVSTGKVSLMVTTNAPGTLSAKATATIANRPSTVGSAERTVAKAGTVSLTLTLSKKARAELSRNGKLTVKVLVAQDNVAIARSVSLKVTQPKTTRKKTKKKSSRTKSRQAATGGRS